MPDELGNFQTTGDSWQERAEKYEGLSAVYAPGDLIRSRWISLITETCLQKATQQLQPGNAVLDFGCGIGQHTKILSLYSGHALGVDITSGMLTRARTTYDQSPINFAQIDGVLLPLRNESIDLIWISTVLRYSLLVPNPKQKDIVKEFSRVLKPGGVVLNFEMYVDLPSKVFSKDFLELGFYLRSAKVVHVQWSKFDRIATGKFRTIFLRRWWAKTCVNWNRMVTREDQLNGKLRDYLFLYQKDTNLGLPEK